MRSLKAGQESPPVLITAAPLAFLHASDFPNIQNLRGIADEKHSRAEHDGAVVETALTGPENCSENLLLSGRLVQQMSHPSPSCDIPKTRNQQVLMQMVGQRYPLAVTKSE